MFEERDLPCSISWFELLVGGGSPVGGWGDVLTGECVDCVKFKGIISFICGIRATQLRKTPTAAPSGHLASAAIISTVTPCGGA